MASVLLGVPSTGINYTVTARIEPPATIVVEERDNITERVVRSVVDTKDKLIRAKLIELGWIHNSMISAAAKRELEVLNEAAGH